MLLHRLFQLSAPADEYEITLPPKWLANSVWHFVFSGHAHAGFSRGRSTMKKMMLLE